MLVATVIAPFLLPLAAWPAGRWVAARLSPPWASALLVASCTVFTLAGLGALLVQTFAGLTLMPAVAATGGFSPAALRDTGQVSAVVSALSGLALIVVVAAAGWSALRYRAWFRTLQAELDRHASEDGVIIVPDRKPLALAVPGQGGRVVVSSGLLSTLRASEREALLAHETAHLRLRHPLFLGVIAAARVVNPLVRPLGETARFALERWADEAAARQVGDRLAVATAVAKAALAGARSAPAPAATGGPVPRRVEALLGVPAPRPRLSPLALFGATVVLTVTVGAAGTALDSATDLHSGIEIAQAGLCRTAPQATHCHDR